MRSLRLLRRLVLCLPLGLLAACASGGEETYYSASRLGSRVAQPFPTAYRAELIAFMRTYLNDPSGIRGALVSEPFQKELGGLSRFVVCLRYDAKDTGGRYTGVADRLALFLDGRFDRLMERAGETCAAQAYAPFPELERLTR